MDSMLQSFTMILYWVLFVWRTVIAVEGEPRCSAAKAWLVVSSTAAKSRRPDSAGCASPDSLTLYAHIPLLLARLLAPVGVEDPPVVPQGKESRKRLLVEAEGHTDHPG